MAIDHAVHVRGLRHGERWIVTVGDDPTPIVERRMRGGRTEAARTRAEAETEARAHAATFGYQNVVVHELDGDELLLRIPDPDPEPPYPGGRGERRPADDSADAAGHRRLVAAGRPPAQKRDGSEPLESSQRTRRTVSPPPASRIAPPPLSTPRMSAT
jgi:hypothetical protein